MDNTTQCRYDVSQKTWITQCMYHSSQQQWITQCKYDVSQRAMEIYLFFNSFLTIFCVI